MLRRRVIVNLAVFAAVAIAFVAWAVTNLVTIDFIENPYEVTADFEDAMGVLPNAEVTYLGTQAGGVSSVERIEGAVRITMKLDNDVSIPADATAHIFRKSALGEQFVDFQNPEELEPDGPVLEEGAHIPIERTTIPIEFADTLRAAEALLESIDPEDLGTITRELAVGLQNREDDLRSLIVEGDRLSRTFAERTDTLDRLASANTRLTRVFAEHSDSLVAALEDLRAVSQSLGEASSDVGPLIEDGAEVFADLVPVVRDHRDSLVCVFNAVDDVLDVSTTDADLEDLETLLTDFPVATERLQTVLDIEEGPDSRVHQWVRVDITDSAENEAEDFNPNKETPPPQPEIPACDVEFASTSEPGAEEPDAPGTGPTPATGGMLAASGGLGLLVLAGLVALIRPRRLP